MQVRTAKLNATNTGAAKIKVADEHGHQRTVGYDHGANDAHEAAVRAVYGNVTIKTTGEARRGYTFEVTPETPVNAL